MSYGGGSVVINPEAVIISFEERYNRALNDPNVSTEYLSNMLNELHNWWARTVEEAQNLSPAEQRARPDLANMAAYAGRVRALSSGIENAANMAAGRDFSQALVYNPKAAAPDQVESIWRDVVDQFNSGAIDSDEAMRQLIDKGVITVQEAFTFKDIFNKAKTSGQAVTPANLGIPLPAKEEGGSDFKPFEPVGDKPTPFLNDFQNAFATYSAEQLAAGKGSIAGGSDNILSRNFQRLQTLYMGELGRRTMLDPTDPLYEDPAVFDFVKVNIGKSLDPQFDQKTDRFQDQRVEPKLKPLDFLRGIDLEDIRDSTVPEDRPGAGRARPGFVGYIRRL